MRRCRGFHRQLFLCACSAILALVAMLAGAAGADAAVTLGPFELNDGSASIPAVQVPTLLAFQASLTGHPGGAGFGRGGAPNQVSELTITKRVDQSSPALQKAVVVGTHFKTGSLIWGQSNGTGVAACLTDAYPISYQLGGAGGGGQFPTETVGIAYAKIAYHYGSGASCAGGGAPPVEATLVKLNKAGSMLTTRLDCLSARCRGILSVSLPRGACPGAPSSCEFTGGVRVGLAGGKVKFDGDGSAFTGGVKVGIGGAGAFSINGGGTKVLRFPVPQPLQKWLKGHSHATLGSIIVVRGLSRAIVEREVLGAPAKIASGVPSLTAEEAAPAPQPGTVPGPSLKSQSLTITECSATVIGTPTVVSISGSLSPARAAAVTLTYEPVNGPPPLPSPIVHVVTTTATGAFGDTFDRHQNGADYSWNVVASIAEGGGYAAASSPPCAIPIP
jgi:type VI protein secretion system component Hcp